MRSVTRLRKLLLLSLAPALSSCALPDGKCTDQVRTALAMGRIDEAGNELVSGQLTVSELRGTQASKTMSWMISGPTIKGHALSAAFKDASSTSQVLLDLPIASASFPEISEGAVDEKPGMSLSGFFDIVAAGRAVIELQTDLSSHPMITIPLTSAWKDVWSRPYCL